MSLQRTGQEHGAVVRRAASRAAGFGSIVVFTVLREVRQVVGYAVGFGQGLLRERDRLPKNA